MTVVVVALFGIIRVNITLVHYITISHFIEATTVVGTHRVTVAPTLWHASFTRRRRRRFFFFLNDFPDTFFYSVFFFFFYFTHITFARRTRAALHDNLLQCIGARRSHLNNKLLCNILLSPQARASPFEYATKTSKRRPCRRVIIYYSQIILYNILMYNSYTIIISYSSLVLYVRVRHYIVIFRVLIHIVICLLWYVCVCVWNKIDFRAISRGINSRDDDDTRCLEWINKIVINGYQLCNHLLDGISFNPRPGTHVKFLN